MISRTRQPERFLATILFTDMVGSTDLAAELGDREWRRVIANHHAIVRQQLHRFGGHEIDNAGDGFLAWFQQPAQAVRAADAILSEVGHLRLSLRAGVHTGECERIGGKVGGIAVHIASRVMAAAEGDEVLVSSTVRDLVQGSGLAFADRGTRELKGVPGEWHLYVLEREPRVADDAAGERQRHAQDVKEAAAARPEQKRRRWPLAAAAIAVLVIVAVVAAAGLGLLSSGPPPVIAAPGPNSIANVNRTSGAVRSVTPVAAGPVDLTIADGYVWTASLDAALISRAKDSGAASAETFGRVGQPTAVAAGNDRIWVADAFDRQVVVLDSTKGDVLRTVSPVPARDIAYGFESLWATDDIADQVRRFDRQTSDVVASIPTGPGTYPGPIAAGKDAVWVGNTGTSTVARIDPTTSSVIVGAIPVRSVPTAIAAGNDDIWIVSRAGDTLLRLDPATNSVAQTFDVGDQPTAVAADGDSVWVGLAGSQELVHLNHDGSELSRLALAGEPTAIAIDGDSVHVAVRQP